MNNQPLLNEISSVDNVCIFVADALRWDKLPDNIAKKGTTIKTIASGLATCISLPTMISGLWPKHHGVLSWYDRVPELTHYLNHPDFDTSYYMPGGENVINDGTFSILRQNKRKHLSELHNSWLYFERHHGGHAPYRAVRPNWDGDWSDFVTDFAGDVEKTKLWYERAIDETAEDFFERVDVIDDRNELADTLIIFTSDHGEYLGEEGLVGHSSPMRPECCYVPTVFIHPELDSITIDDAVARHVDLFPTVLSALDKPIPDNVDGVDLFNHSPVAGYSLSYTSIKILNRVIPTYHASGLWDIHGGHVFNNTNLLSRIASSAGLLAKPNSWKASHIRRNFSNFPSAATRYVQSNSKFGNPSLSKNEARELVDKIEQIELEMTENNNTNELSENTIEQLKDMGYLN